MPDINELQEDKKALTKGSQYMSVRQALEKQSTQLKDALPPTISTKRFLRVVYTQMHVNPALQKCSKESLIASTFKAAERGMMPNGRHAALVPYWNNQKRVFEAQFQEMYQGLIHMARKAGDIADIIPATICENDEWSYELGLHMDLRHKPALSNRGKPVAYYAVIIFPDGRKSFGPGPMSADEVSRIQKRSKAKRGPWDTDYEPMAWKTVIKRNLKYIGASPELEEHLIEDDELEYGRMDVSQPVYEEPAPEQVQDLGEHPQVPKKPARSLGSGPIRWPQWDAESQTWRDSAYEAYDPEKHSTPMKCNERDGKFRKRRHALKKDQPETQPETAPEEAVPPSVPQEVVTGGDPGSDVPF